MMLELTFHLLSGKKLVFALGDEETAYLEHCLENDVRWFRLAEQSVNLHHVVMVTT